MPFGLNIHCKAFPREKRKLLRTAQVYFQDDTKILIKIFYPGVKNITALDQFC